MRNMKIAVKLIVGFLIVAVLAAVVGIIGINGMTDLEEAGVQMYEMNLRSIEILGDLREDFQEEQIELRNLAMTVGSEDNAGKIDDSVAYLAQLKSQIEGNLTAYEGTMMDPAEETDYFKAKDAYTGAYDTNKEKAIAAAKAGDQAAVQEAIQANLDNAAAVTQGLGASATLNSQQADATTAEDKEMADRLEMIQLIVLIAAVAVAIILGLYIAMIISKPIKECVKRIDQLAKEGDLKSPVTVYDTKDEIGTLSRTTKELVEGVGGMINDQGRVLNAMANGDFTQELAGIYVGEFTMVRTSTEKIAASMNDALLRINQSSSQVSMGANQVSNGAQELAQGATEQATTVQELADTLTTTADGIQVNAQKADEVSKKVGAVGDEMAESNNKMNAMISAMEQINESSSEIGKIIKTIEDIAFQTNILALNAAVEAARAGAAGQGFAVVADEVRNLASKSAEASKNTASLIETSMAAVDNGSRIASETAQSLSAAVEGTQEVVSKISEISEGTTAQAAAITQIKEGVDQISTVVQNNSATAQESAAASEELSGQAQMMRELVARFKLSGEEPSIEAPDMDMDIDSFSNAGMDFSSDYSMADDDLMAMPPMESDFDNKY